MPTNILGVLNTDRAVNQPDYDRAQDFAVDLFHLTFAKYYCN